MGRKPAPQPLSLPLADDDAAAAADSASAASSHSQPSAAASTSANASASATLNSPESTVPGVHDRPSSRPGLTGETSSLQVVSPGSSHSSKSPRSPLSKFNINRTPQEPDHPYSAQAQHRGPQPRHPADDLHVPQRQQRPPHHNPAYTPVASPIPHAVTTPVLPEPYRPPDEEKPPRGASRFFHFGKSSRSVNQIQHSHAEGRGEGMSRGIDHPAMQDRGSTKTSKHSDQSSVEHSHQKSASSLPSRSDISLPSTTDLDTGANKKSKPKPFALLGRNRSFKDKDDPGPKESVTMKMTEPGRLGAPAGTQPLKTAPINPETHDRAFRHMMDSSTRNQSADRAAPRDRSQNKENRPDKDQKSHPAAKDHSGPSFFGGLKSSGSRAADMISKGLFGKSARSASTTEREPVVDDEHYVLKVINLPLVEQTRKTRISKRLEDSRDKTEFWMPAFPWRAIDYLNFNGTDVEGLYRVPGSGPQIKKWQRKFDEEYDVDLFAQDDLYDINIIGSMLKAWLRELPDELFPKEAQDRISRECAGAEEVPQMLIDELSNLSPFNYYLLFAITCHLSLLLAHSDKNKMDFRNLCICFQPCMKIDAFCFKFLVCDWRLCWQGCKQEAKYIEEEYTLFQQPLPRGLSSSEQPSQTSSEAYEERAISSSDSKQSTPSNGQQNGKLKKKVPSLSQSNGSASQPAGSGNLTVAHEPAPRKRSGDLRPLSPIKPLSPMNF
ncbi:hypothetical protein F4780DRAFT_616036 [Xylariomycetidae sp. FL0641]|nr:hypothetical protein F4780DRAFT_616036 [Xylariomycetidae sp. FL0641]